MIHTLAARLEERQDVLGRDVGLDVVDGCQDPAAAVAHEIEHAVHSGAHVVRRAMRQEALAVDAAPEGDAVAELPLEPALAPCPGQSPGRG